MATSVSSRACSRWCAKAAPATVARRRTGARSEFPSLQLGVVAEHDQLALAGKGFSPSQEFSNQRRGSPFARASQRRRASVCIGVGVFEAQGLQSGANFWVVPGTLVPFVLFV